MRQTSWLCLAFLLAGCSSAPSPQQQAIRSEFERTVPTCEGELDCKAKWEVAQLWIVQNAGFKIQAATDVVIETYNPDRNSPRIAARAVKEPLGGGRYRIVVSVWCANAFGCVPDSWQAAIDFNRKVGAAAP